MSPLGADELLFAGDGEGDLEGENPEELLECELPEEGDEESEELLLALLLERNFSNLD